MKNISGMKKLTILLYIFFCMLFTGYTGFSQQACWVFFTDKNNTSFDPYTYFDAYAIERRVKNNLSLYDTTDFPLTSSYVRKVTALSEEVIGETRWFNALAVFATTENIVKIQSFPFVKEIIPIQTNLTLCSYREMQMGESIPVITDEFDDNLKQLPPQDQVSRMDGNVFIKNNIDGQGIRIAVFDAGFSQVNTHVTLEHLRKNNSIVKTWNFCNKKEDVYGYNSHGRMVLSCIAGIKDTQKLGLATGAEFLLAKTEINLEIYKEEVWWMMAAEWADKNGAHIINSSLGYGGDRYQLFDMNGKSTLVTRAANMAASKGILVVNSAGNEGTKTRWNYSIIAPADADSILTVGGISPNDTRVNFSSRGPTADGRLKPNVVAYGHATVAQANNHTGVAAGTSFSSPLIAGFAACAWQTNRNLNNMQLKTEIEHSADLYPYFDYDHGYGVPQASYFFDGKTATDTNIVCIVETDDTIQVFIDPAIDKEFKEKKRYPNQNYIYYHIQNEKGGLIKYLVLSPSANEKQNNDKYMVAQIEKQELKQGYILRIYYNGIVKEYSK
ncbi:MAG: S8 family serine peptidase [Bacteroidales bacterium]|jgi:hypothetical protein|nr:S8 family serine peptidase [Bacteroidales bacterium]